jgi:hypothetical protein
MHSLNPFRSVGIAGLLASCALAACANGGDEAILITKNVAPADMCTFSGDPAEPFIPHGFVAPQAGGYDFHPQMESRLIADVANDPSSTAQRTILVTDANIDITFPANPELDAIVAPALTHFKELLSAPITPGGTTDAAIEIIHGELIDAIVAAQTSATFDIEMQISIVANGNYSGNAVTSQTFTYPVTLTTGLVQVAGACPLPASTMIAAGNSCNLFQDNPVTCCTEGTQLICPATTM